VQLALSTVSQAIKPLRKDKHISWILDSGFDESTVWHTLWEDQDPVVCRVYHTDRLVVCSTCSRPKPSEVSLLAPRQGREQRSGGHTVRRPWLSSGEALRKEPLAAPIPRRHLHARFFRWSGSCVGAQGCRRGTAWKTITALKVLPSTW